MDIVGKRIHLMFESDARETLSNPYIAREGPPEPVTEDTREEVFENLNNAEENGYNMAALPPAQICLELIAYGPKLEDHTPAQLLPFVLEWLKNKGE